MNGIYIKKRGNCLMSYLSKGHRQTPAEQINNSPTPICYMLIEVYTHDVSVLLYYHLFRLKIGDFLRQV